jgi:hypothetical protein
MSYLGKHEFSEKGRVGIIALFTIGTIAATSGAIDALGLSRVWTWVHHRPAPLGLLAAMALWGGAMLAITHGGRAASFAGRLAARGATWGAKAGAGLGAAVIIFVLRGTLSVIRALPAVVLGPYHEVFALRWQALWQRGLGRTALIRQRLRQEWTLWRAYRREFRGRQFASYRAFRRQFAAGARSGESGSGAQPQGRSAPDPIAAACKLMGLPEDGFSEAQFRARYRVLMKELHPDRGGSNEHAARVNAACALIKKRKGWS